MSRTVRLDGLRIALSPSFKLPLPDAAVGGPPDWTVDFAPSPLSFPEENVSWTGHVGEGGVRWARFGRIAGRRLVRLEGVLDLEADPESGSATIGVHRPDLDPVYTLRRAMPYLVGLARGGAVALHAACVVINGQGVLLCGDSGAGKSTWALALDARGVPVLADDHVAVRHVAAKHVASWPGGTSLVAAASMPAIEAAPDAAKHFRPELEPASDKRSVALSTPRPDEVPVGRIVFLARGAGGAARSVEGPEVARRLLADVVFVADPASAVEQERRLDVTARLAKDAVAVELPVPEGLDRLDVLRLAEHAR